MWPGVLAAEQPAALVHLLEHVAVADLRASERDARARERLLEAEVAHQRADDAAVELAAPLRSRIAITYSSWSPS